MTPNEGSLTRSVESSRNLQVSGYAAVATPTHGKDPGCARTGEGRIATSMHRFNDAALMFIKIPFRCSEARASRGDRFAVTVVNQHCCHDLATFDETSSPFATDRPLLRGFRSFAALDRVNPIVSPRDLINYLCRGISIGMPTKNNNRAACRETVIEA